MSEPEKLSPEAIAFFAKHGSAGGKIGGLAGGPRKARTSKQARAAALAGWAKRRAKNSTKE